MKRPSLWGLIAPIFLLSTLILVGCQKRGTQNNNTAIFCSEGSPSKFNPQIVSDGTSITASSNTVFDRLVETDTKSLTIVPGLAKRWEVGPNGLTYTFYLRENVSFHSNELFTPTRSFNAHDVIYSIKRMIDPKHPLHEVSGGIYEAIESRNIHKNIKSITPQGDYQVKIVLHKPEAPFISYMANYFMSITSQEYGQKLIALGRPELFDMKPIGTGPFVFKKYVRDTLIRYDAHKGHFAHPPKIDHLIFNITPDPNVRFQKLKTGECHIIFEPSRSDIASIKQHPELRLSQANGINVGYLAMNTQKPPFNNRDVRRAVNMALNKQSYLDAIYLGHAISAKNPIPPNIWGYNKETKEHEYNPKKAKQLLAKAGFPQGFETELWALPVSRPYNPDGRKMGEMMQADLQKIGIKAKVVTYDWGTYLEKARKGEHHMIQLGWSSDSLDPNNFLYVLLSCSSAKAGANSARFCHPEFDRLVEQAKSIPSQEERTKLYMKAQEIFNQELPWAPIAHSIIYRGVRKNVEGYDINPLGDDRFHSMTLK